VAVFATRVSPAVPKVLPGPTLDLVRQIPVAFGPDDAFNTTTFTPDPTLAAIAAGGGVVVPLQEAEALIWFNPHEPARLRTALESAPNVQWVQLPWAGVEPMAAAGIFADGRVWTCGKGVYGVPVAEHALALTLAGLSRLPELVRATSWNVVRGNTLHEANITILGAGGIATEFMRLVAPFNCNITIVRRQEIDTKGAARTYSLSHLNEAVADADVVLVALALTPETTHVVNAATFAAMRNTAWLVNVGRGAHVVTDDLVNSLNNNQIAGAALNVTDPEPLPDGHALWNRTNCIVTPHAPGPVHLGDNALYRRITDNIRKWARNEPLEGQVDTAAGY